MKQSPHSRPAYGSSTCFGNAGQSCELSTGRGVPWVRNFTAPADAHSQTSWAPALKQRAIFSSISASVLPDNCRVRELEGAHDDMAVAVGFDAAFDLGQFGIGQQLGPAAQVESGLGLVRRQFNGQRCHTRKAGLRGAARNLGERVCACAAPHAATITPPARLTSPRRTEQCESYRPSVFQP
jgi:hypothetical protein